MYKSSPTPEADDRPLSKGAQTKEKIFQLALAYFNEHGMEFVGIRELARQLNLSPGNVSYYFPTKEALIHEISRRLSEENSKIFLATERDLTLRSFLELFRTAFHNHYAFRCLFVSVVQLMKHYPSIRERYLDVQVLRRASLRKDLLSLRKQGALRSDLTSSDINYLVAVISYHARSWIIEAEILHNDKPLPSVIDHYVGLIAQTLQPYCTAKGRTVLTPFEQRILKIT